MAVPHLIAQRERTSMSVPRNYCGLQKKSLRALCIRARIRSTSSDFSLLYLGVVITILR